jgi:hypothetical protein
MNPPQPAIQPIHGRYSAIVLTVVFLALAVLIFVALYFTLPDNEHYGALLLIGVLSLVFALCSYLAEAFSRDPAAQRSLAWGFFGMGFTVLYLTVILGPFYINGILTPIEQLTTVIVLTVVLAVSIVGVVWRMRAVRATENEMVSRAAWRNEPAPSALSYGAANSPSVPKVTAPPPSAPPAPPRSP